MYSLNQMCEVLQFVCSKMADEIALNCLLQIEQKRSEEETVGYALALTFC